MWKKVIEGYKDNPIAFWGLFLFIGVFILDLVVRIFKF